ncbi:MAG TPA: hypothetical protein VN633_04160 [Bryobacteraceae bacterium]|nr:hypothetical protein [Bryobacteraceae bacterium]
MAGAFALASMAAAAPPANPFAGVVREPDQTLHSVYGFSSNLINGAPLPIRGVRAAYFSSDAGIVFIAGSLEFVSLDGAVLGSYATEELHPVLGVAAAWLPSEEKLVRWSGSQFSAFALSAAKLPGPIVALQANSTGSIDLWVNTQTSAVQHFRLSLHDGALSPLETVTGLNSNVAVVSGSLISVDSGNLRIQSFDGTVRSLRFPFSDLTFEPASDHWIHIVSDSGRRQWMLHVDASGASLSELPAVAPLTVEVTR